MQHAKHTALFGAIVLLMSLVSRTSLAEPSLKAGPYPYLVGDSVVTISVEEYGSGPTFISLHDNENTSVNAARAIIKQHGGRLIELIHDGERNITFHHRGITYVFDPNRIFSERGIVDTLRTQGKTYSREAYDIVRNFATVFLVHFEHGFAPGEKMVSVHNNTNGDYSLESYIGDLAADASAVHQNPSIDPDDFFLVTTKALFAYFKSHEQNVVLQSKRATDDGSLSVYAAQKGIPYVNVEAQVRHKTIQQHMLALLL